jgi:hypothetical protein
MSGSCFAARTRISTSAVSRPSCFSQAAAVERERRRISPAVHSPGCSKGRRRPKFVGGETEIAYYPAVIDNSTNALAKNRVISFSGDTLIGPTIGRVKGGASDFMRNRSITAKCAICGRAYCLLWCRGRESNLRAPCGTQDLKSSECRNHEGSASDWSNGPLESFALFSAPLSHIDP